MKRIKLIALSSVLVLSITNLNASSWYSTSDNSDKRQTIKNKYGYKNKSEQKGFSAIKDASELINKNRIYKQKNNLSNIKKETEKNKKEQIAGGISTSPTMDQLMEKQEQDSQASMTMIKDFTNMVMGLNRYKRKGGFPYSDRPNDDRWNKRGYVAKEVAPKWKYETKTKGKFFGMIRRVMGYVVIEPKLSSYSDLKSSELYEALKQKCLNGEQKVKGTEIEAMSETNLKCVIENNVSIYKWY